MIVYAVMWSAPYETGMVLALWSTQSAAEDYAIEQQAMDDYNTIHVLPMEVQD